MTTPSPRTIPKSHTGLLIATTLMLFSMFFGAGNLIFPPLLGYQAGTSFWPAIIGFLGTGVVLTVAAIVAIALSGDDVRDLANRAGKVFGLVFPILAYLSIGAFYALPRTGAVSFDTAITPLLGVEGMLASGIFNFIFFGIALALSWNPNTVVSTLGKFLTPALVILLFLLIGVAVFGYDATDAVPQGAYAENAPFAAGLVEGYLTMDAIAALAFGIVVISTLRYNGIEQGRPLIRSSVITGIGAGILLAVIYIGLGIIGRVAPQEAGYDSGTTILTDAASAMLGGPGLLIFALIVLLACLTTAVGLITSTSEFFHTLTPGISYRAWAVIFAVASFGMATMGLSTVLAIAAPVIGFIYPPAIALILITLLSPLFGRTRYLRWTYILGVWTAVIWSALTTIDSFGLDLSALIGWAPWQAASLGWALPTLIATIIGLIIDLVGPKREYANPAGLAAIQR